MSFEGMGAVLDTEPETCGFRVWAPNASSVHVTGSLCEWRENEPPVAKEGRRYSAATTRGVGAGEPYRFVIQDGSQHWRVDAYEDTGNGPDARSAGGDGQLSIRLPKWSALCFHKVG